MQQCIDLVCWTGFCKLPVHYFLERRKKTERDRGRKTLHGPDPQNPVQMHSTLRDIGLADEHLVYPLDIVTKRMTYRVGELV